MGPGLFSCLHLQNKVHLSGKKLQSSMLSLSRTVFRGLSRRISVSARNTSNASSESAESKTSVLLSDSAVQRLKTISGDQGWLRVSVEGGGCSGFQYKFELEDGGEAGAEDVLVERDGARVMVDQTSLEYLQGSTIDYHVELIRAGFRIASNPLAEGGCSCGASFNIKLEL